MCLKNWHSINIILFLSRKLERHYYKVCQTPVHSTGALQLPRKHCTVSIQLEGQFIPQMVLHSLLIGTHFFSGAPEYEPARKVRVVSSTKIRGQLQSEQQHSEEEATFESLQAQPQPDENLPSTSRAQQFHPGSGINDPLSTIKQTLYPQYDVYNVDINNPLYDTKAHVAQCPPKNMCYCGRGCNSQKELAAHIDKRHADGIYQCLVCEYQSDNPRHVWKHYRTQHRHVHTLVCKVKCCKDCKNNKAYGNDEQHTVWAQMATAHKIPNPMSCPKYKKLMDSLLKKDRVSIS